MPGCWRIIGPRPPPTLAIYLNYLSRYVHIHSLLLHLLGYLLLTSELTFIYPESTSLHFSSPWPPGYGPPPPYTITPGYAEVSVADIETSPRLYP